MFNLNTGLLYHFFPETRFWFLYDWYILLPAVLFVCAVSYLLGSINSAIIISRIGFGEDIRTKGSGNAGTTNMLRNYGKAAAGLTLLGDLLKTAISIAIAGLIFGFNYVGGISVGEMCYVAGLFSIIGHIFPIYYKFRGGKGVLSTATMVLILSPALFAVLILIFIGIVAFSKFISLGSVISAVLYPVVLNGYFTVFAPTSKPEPLMVLSSILLACLIVWCHRTNLSRISRGEENKFSFGKKKDVPEEPVDEDADEDVDDVAEYTEESENTDGADTEK